MDETTTVDENGTAISVECEGVSMPADFSFKSVNAFVNDFPSQEYETLQALCLGLASENDSLKMRANKQEPVAVVQSVKEVMQGHCDATITPIGKLNVGDKLYTSPPNQEAEIARLRQALEETIEALHQANESENSPISDTIWMPRSCETLFDFIESTLEVSNDE